MKKIKKLFLLVAVFVCMFAFTSCSDSKNEKVTYSYSESDLVTYISEDVQALGKLTDDSIDKIIQDCEPFEGKQVLKKAMESWKLAKKDAGNIVDIYKDESGAIKYTLTTKDNELHFNVKVQCEKRDVVMKYTFGIVDDELDVKELTYEAEFTMLETLSKAALNTLMGISTVIVVLAFLSIIISLFKFINKAQNKAANRKSAVKDGLDNTLTQIVEKEEISAEDDTELVAVITAAIASMEQTTTDGFVVRSIRKVPNSKWKRS